MAKGVKTAATQPGEEKNFIRKAQKFLEGAEEMLQRGNHESAAVLAVHCVISSCDALTAKLLGCKHVGDDHLGIINLLKDLPLRDNTERNNKIRQVKEVLMKKTQAEYESKSVRKADTETMVTQASRIFTWGKELVEP